MKIWIEIQTELQTTEDETQLEDPEDHQGHKKTTKNNVKEYYRDDSPRPKEEPCRESLWAH